MTKLDYYWLSNKAWSHRLPNGTRVINEDAPKEAKDSYERYLQQSKKAEERGTV